MKNSEILREINCTLDQLIKNASALTEISGDPLFKSEIQALNKTQESLLAHLVHLDQFLKDKQKETSSLTIHKKLTTFHELSTQISKKKTSSYSKNRIRMAKKNQVTELSPK